MHNPYIVEETENYAVVFKPAKMHSAMLGEVDSTTNRNLRFLHEPSRTEEKEQRTLQYWFNQEKGYNKDVRLMHRLDFETHGLVLFAKNEKSFLFFKDIQNNDEFVKEYSAICSPHSSLLTPHSSLLTPHSSLLTPNPSLLTPNPSLPTPHYLEGFPPFPHENSSVIESYFRPYGPGRKQVRPVIDDGKKHKEIAKDKGGFYRTEIIVKKENVFTVRIKRGFRHQIRCHLYWAGFPILNDPLYTCDKTITSDEQLALRSHALFFADPASGERRECRIEPLK